ncbi:MAG: ROK family protein [Magnetovibrionaceae bacterium]
MRIGIDLGGTKIEGLLLDAAGREIARLRIDSPQGDYPATLKAIKGLVEALEPPGEAKATVGVGIPGTISPATGLVKNANSTWLIGEALDRDLMAVLGRPVRLANDANCFAVSEATDGAAAGAVIAFGVILGTGVGGGIAINGLPITGSQAIAGEWGHNPLPWPDDNERPGPTCYCGLSGCIETFLSGPAMAADHLCQTGETMTAAQIAVEDSEAARNTIERYRSRLAKALASVVNILDPDVIVLGGGLSNIDALYDGLAEAMGPWVFTDQFATPIRKAKHGDSSGVRGAAWLWPPS